MKANHSKKRKGEVQVVIDKRADGQSYLHLTGNNLSSEDIENVRKFLYEALGERAKDLIIELEVMDT